MHANIGDHSFGGASCQKIGTQVQCLKYCFCGILIIICRLIA